MYYNLKNIDSTYISKYGEIASSYIETKKSKFYCYTFSISSDGQATKYIDLIRNNNKDAKHVVYVYSYINNNNVAIKFSDDGEPQSTGTKGILELIQKENITNICIVIVRYFGGILLGAGPLARTYLNTFRQIIDKTLKGKLHIYCEIAFEFSYDKLKDINNYIKKYIDSNEVIVDDIKYSNIINMKLKIDKKLYEDITNNINTLII